MTAQYDQKNAVAGWGTSTQLMYGPPTPYRLRIIGAFFDKSMRRKTKADRLFLNLVGEVLDVDNLQPIPEWEKGHTLELDCGSGWETPDNGKSAQHKNRDVFDGRSAAGEFVNQVLANSALKPLFNELVSRGMSTEAHVYIGLDMVIGEKKMKGNEEAGIPDYGRAIPLEYHGTIDIEEVSKKKAEQDKELTSQLEKLARDATDFDDFQNEAMSLGIKDSQLLDHVMDPSEDGFYIKTTTTEGE